MSLPRLVHHLTRGGFIAANGNRMWGLRSAHARFTRAVPDNGDEYNTFIPVAVWPLGVDKLIFPYYGNRFAQSDGDTESGSVGYRSNKASKEV